MWRVAKKTPGEWQGEPWIVKRWSVFRTTPGERQQDDWNDSTDFCYKSVTELPLRAWQRGECFRLNPDEVVHDRFWGTNCHFDRETLRRAGFSDGTTGMPTPLFKQTLVAVRGTNWELVKMAFREQGTVIGGWFDRFRRDVELAWMGDGIRPHIVREIARARIRMRFEVFMNAEPVEFDQEQDGESGGEDQPPSAEGSQSSLHLGLATSQEEQYGESGGEDQPPSAEGAQSNLGLATSQEDQENGGFPPQGLYYHITDQEPAFPMPTQSLCPFKECRVLLLCCLRFRRLCCPVCDCFLIRRIVIGIVILVNFLQDAPLPLFQVLHITALRIVLLILAYLGVCLHAFSQWALVQAQASIEVNGLAVPL